MTPKQMLWCRKTAWYDQQKAQRSGRLSSVNQGKAHSDRGNCPIPFQASAPLSCASVNSNPNSQYFTTALTSQKAMD